MDRGREKERSRDSYSSSKKKSHKSKSKHRSSDNDSDDYKYKSRSKKKSHEEKSKKKSHKRDKKSPSDSSESSSEENIHLYKRLEAKQEDIILQRKREKELMKANETPEEKRLRRLLKKEAKERKRKQRMGWDKDYLHYTNSDNPFGDANILSSFVWAKKLAKDGLTNVSREELERRNREKQMENKAELEKVKQRRLEREREREEREEAMQSLQREREAEQFEVWERQEDQFHLDQARLRSKIRIADARAKPIDLLAKYINSEEEVDTVEMHEPYTYLNGLTIKDLEDLIEDIKVYIKLEHGRNLDYWNDITVIVEDELHKLRKLAKKTDFEVAVGRREGIHESVVNEVSSVFKSKTAGQLEALKRQIEKKINDKVEGTDIGYWESLLSQLKAHIARARLRDRHQENLKKKLEVLKAEQGVEQEAHSSSSTAPEQYDRRALIDSNDDRPEKADKPVDKNDSSDDSQPSDDDEDSKSQPEDVASAMVNESLIEYGRGCYSPVLLLIEDLEPGTLIIPEDEDEQRLQYARLRLLHPQQLGGMEGEVERAMQKEARKGMTNEEAVFSVEAPLDSQNYLWSDKYRPRKPRYFNRVHTGFEWNKYNQTHYDMDNPPPKIVQGYKFNIFYPDLIDKNSTPQYFLTVCADNSDFSILRFHAGPPYEDIAFKIVNREWEYSYKRGFRCQFHNNIFQLWFHFKRYRYRR